MPDDKLYLGIISEEELNALRKHPSPGRIHPLLNVADGSDGRARHRFESAARLISAKNPDWLQEIKSRLLATDDTTHASSAMGEVRAFGALLETWMDVRPGPSVPYSRVSPEFGA